MHFTYGTGKSKTLEKDFITLTKNFSKDTNEVETDNEKEEDEGLTSPNLKSPEDFPSKKKDNHENEKMSDSDNEKEELSDLENDVTLKNIKQSMDENIFVEMKVRSKQLELINRKSLLPENERRESGLLNQKEIIQMDKGYKIIKNTQTIKENKNILKICDLLKFLCLLYIKSGSATEIPNLISIYYNFILNFFYFFFFKCIFFFFFLQMHFFFFCKCIFFFSQIDFALEMKNICNQSFKQIKVLAKDVSTKNHANLKKRIKETKQFITVLTFSNKLN